MHKVVLSGRCCVPEIGDFIAGQGFLVEQVKKSETDEGDFIYLNNRFTPWATLNLLGVNTEELQRAATYQCPFVEGNRYYAVMPVCLRVADAAVYRVGSLDRSSWDYIFDFEWTRQYLKEEMFKPNKVMRSLMGHGYTTGTLPSDGSNDIEYYWVGLDNEDTLYCAVWEWYNK